jgi:prephenate dehydrogenase
MTIGLIGYGRFGRLAARYLARHAEVVVYDPARTANRRRRQGIRFGTMEEAASQAVVILAVPVSSFRAAVRQIRRHVRPGTLVIDTCAVKALPARWMKEILPRSVSILATHPLFGPDSAARSLSGKTIVLCPVRISRARLGSILRGLRRKGLRTTVMSVEEHDRMAAETILLAQYVGRYVGQACVQRWPGVTRNYRNLLRLVDIAERDSFTLLADMVRYNPEGKKVLARLRNGGARLHARLAVKRHG